MSPATSSSMHDARDAEDRRLLETGDHTQLLANYLHQIRERCGVRIRDPWAADDVAQTIVLRLWRELEDGQHRGPHPFRVVVWQVTNWMIGGHFRQRPYQLVGLDDFDGPTFGDVEAWESEHLVAELVGELPTRQRQMVELVHGEGLAPGEAAARLGITANAGYQALHNAHRKLGERLSGL